MHEVSIVEGLIELVEKEKEKHHFSRVLEVQIVCGIYNCVSEENLEFCLKTVAKGTYLETAKITVNRLPDAFRASSVRMSSPKKSKRGSRAVRSAGLWVFYRY